MRRPTLRERLRPVELVGFAAVLGAFTGLIAILATRDLRVGSIFAGIAFIAALLVLAMLALAAGDPGDEGDERPLQARREADHDADG